MMFGVFTVRVPRPGWQPGGLDAGRSAAKTMVTTENVTADRAIRTPQFWLLWVVLCMNVTAGIGVLGQASPMIQEMFPGSITAAAAARVRRAAEPRQHGRAVLLVVALGLRRPEGHVRDVLRAGRRAVRRRAVDRPSGERRAVRAGLRGHHEHVRRRFRDDSRVPPRHVRHACRSARFTGGCSPRGPPPACSGPCS